MFPRLLFFIVVLLSPGAGAAEREIKVDWKICSITGDAKVPMDAARLRNNPKVDVVRPPPFAIASGKTGEASVTRAFGKNGKSAVPVGVFLSIRPTRVGNRFGYSVASKRTEYLGRTPGGKDAYTVRRITGMNGTCAAGEPVWLELGTEVNRRLIRDNDDDAPARVSRVKRRLVAILTFTEA